MTSGYGYTNTSYRSIRHADFNRRDKCVKLNDCLVETAHLLIVYVVSTRQKQALVYMHPPIEIGGYKYIVPNGTVANTNFKKHWFLLLIRVNP
jgi:hypothetical protein